MALRAWKTTTRSRGAATSAMKGQMVLAEVCGSTRMKVEERFPTARCPQSAKKKDFVVPKKGVVFMGDSDIDY